MDDRRRGLLEAIAYGESADVTAADRMKALRELEVEAAVDDPETLAIAFAGLDADQRRTILERLLQLEGVIAELPAVPADDQLADSIAAAVVANITTARNRRNRKPTVTAYTETEAACDRLFEFTLAKRVRALAEELAAERVAELERQLVAARQPPLAAPQRPAPAPGRPALPPGDSEPENGPRVLALPPPGHDAGWVPLGGRSGFRSGFGRR